MSLTAGDALTLYKNIFQDELLALIRSDEHSGLILNAKQKKVIRKNTSKIAEIAANYFVQNYGTNQNNEKIVQKAIDQSIKEALRNIKQ